MLLLSAAGCHSDAQALKHYLDNEQPRLTQGVGTIMTAFEELLATPAPIQKRLQELDQRVLVPYRRLIHRLEAFQAGSALVNRHHQAYVRAARLQLTALEAAREAIRKGTSLERVSGMFDVSRQGLDAWLQDLRAEAKSLDITLDPAPTDPAPTDPAPGPEG